MLLTLRIVLRGISAVPVAWFPVDRGFIQHTRDRSRRLGGLITRLVLIHREVVVVVFAQTVREEGRMTRARRCRNRGYALE